MLVKDGVDRFLVWKGSYIKNTKSYASALQPFLLLYGATELEKFDSQDVAKLVHTLRLKYNDGYVFFILTVIKMFTRYAFYSGVKTINPELIKPKRPVVIMPYATRDDLETLCDHCDDRNFTGIRNELILRMLFESGARVSELIDLTLEDLGSGQENQALIKTKKNDLPRYLMWSKDTHRILLSYLGLRLSKDYKTTNLFISKNGTEMTVRAVQHMITALRRKVGMKKALTPHSFRHGCAHEKANKGANLKEIGVILGHHPNNMQSALHYLRFDSQESLAILRKYL